MSGERMADEEFEKISLGSLLHVGSTALDLLAEARRARAREAALVRAIEEALDGLNVSIVGNKGHRSDAEEQWETPDEELCGLCSGSAMGSDATLIKHEDDCPLGILSRALRPEGE